MTQTAYVPSPRRHVRDQVASYEATGGREGGTIEGRPVVILTTTGAVTGTIRKTPLIRIEHDGVYFVVASAAGGPRHPDWYRNAVSCPDVRLQDGERVHRLRAREVTGAEKDRAWQLAEAHWPHFPSYRAAAGREIPILALEPES